MDLNNIFRLANNFFHAHTFIAIGIIIGLIILACMKPKKTVQAVLLVLGLIVAGYVLYYIGDAAMSGVSEKHQMIDH